MGLKEKIKIKVLGYKATNSSYLEHLRNRGIKVGNNVKFFRPYNTTIDIQNPHLLSIGDDVMITGPVTILTHDYSWSVIKKKYGEVVGNQRPVKIGNNVFIGWGATILAGSIIGDNTVIGANSVVSGVVESNSVYAGNPAKRLMSIDEFYKKRKLKQLTEAVNYVLAYREAFGDYPAVEEMDEYFFLFSNRESAAAVKAFDDKLHLMDNYEASLKALDHNKPQFDSYEEFIDYCKGQ